MRERTRELWADPSVPSTIVQVSDELELRFAVQNHALVEALAFVFLDTWSDPRGSDLVRKVYKGATVVGTVNNAVYWMDKQLKLWKAPLDTEKGLGEVEAASPIEFAKVRVEREEQSRREARLMGCLIAGVCWAHETLEMDTPTYLEDAGGRVHRVFVDPKQWAEDISQELDPLFSKEGEIERMEVHLLGWYNQVSGGASRASRAPTNTDAEVEAGADFLLPAEDETST